MPSLSSAPGLSKAKPVVPVADEIAIALSKHEQVRRKAAHGIILGVEKYKQLRSRTTNLAGSYQGVSIVIDASQPMRVSIF